MAKLDREQAEGQWRFFQDVRPFAVDLVLSPECIQYMQDLNMHSNSAFFGSFAPMLRTAGFTFERTLVAWETAEQRNGRVVYMGSPADERPIYAVAGSALTTHSATTTKWRHERGVVHPRRLSLRSHHLQRIGFLARRHHAILAVYIVQSRRGLQILDLSIASTPLFLRP